MGMPSEVTVVADPLTVISGAPILSCVHKGVPGIFMDCHMMVAQPEKVPHVSPHLALLFLSAVVG
jgi:hypothetical protein